MNLILLSVHLHVFAGILPAKSNCNCIYASGQRVCLSFCINVLYLYYWNESFIYTMRITLSGRIFAAALLREPNCKTACQARKFYKAKFSPKLRIKMWTVWLLWHLEFISIIWLYRVCTKKIPLRLVLLLLFELHDYVLSYVKICFFFFFYLTK